MRKTWLLIFAVVLVGGFLLARPVLFNDENNGVSGKKERITFGFTPWTTTFPGTFVAKKLIEDELGYPTELKEADVGVVYAGLAKGDIDVFMDSWLPVLHEDYMNQYGDEIEDLTTIYSGAILGWGVPNYVDERLQSLGQLNDYRDLFDGRVTGIDPGAGMSRTSKRLIEEYGLDYEYIASSEAAMLTEVATAFKKQEPLLFLIYRPHSMFAKWDIRVLEDPKGVWTASEVHALANVSLKEKAPEVHQFLTRFKMSIDDYEEWILRQDEQDENPEDLAEEWIRENPDRVQAFLGK